MTIDAQHPRRSIASQREAALLLFLFLLVVYLLSAALRIDSGDGEAMYQVTRSIVEGRGFAIPAPPPGTMAITADEQIVAIEELSADEWWPYGAWGADGRYYSKYGIGWSLAAIPFYVSGSAIVHVIPELSEGYTTRAAVTLVDTVAASLAAVVLFLLATRFYPTPVAALITLGYGLGTIVWAYARGTFSEPLVALGLLWTAFAAVRAEEGDGLRWWALAGLGLGIALLSRPTAVGMILPFAACAFLAGWRTRRWRGGLLRLAALSAPLCLALAIVLGYNAVRFGSPLDFGYPQTVWSPNGLVGMYGMLLSPGKGLLLFAPLVLLGLAGWPRFLRRYPLQAGAMLTMVLLQLFLYAFTRRDWDGGASWGPRHFVPVMAFLLLPAGEVLQRARVRRGLGLVVSVLLAISLLIQLLGISVNTSHHLQRVFARYGDFSTFFQHVNFAWADSPLPGQLRSLQEVAAVVRQPENRELLRELIAAEEAQDPEDGQAEAVSLLSYNVPDFWFIYWGFLGVGAVWRMGLAVVLVGLGAWAAVRLRRFL